MSVYTTQTHEPRSIADSETITLANSVVELEAGPAGTIARIHRVDGVEYAGPIDDQTTAALREVGR